ncbi:MAG: HD-GYP domain-containing protein [Epulopiscium sp.]|nr:HD-GYP domain-containing protein [Candidatus Epulonipiscium sp.]
MSPYLVRRILLEEAVPGMKVAQDILTDTGLILISQNTILKENHIDRLKLYRTPFISIYDSVSVQYERREWIDSTPIKSVQNIELFKKFRSVYENKQKEVENKLFDISEGEKTNGDELFSISQDIYSLIHSKSELFSFLHHMRSNNDFTYNHSVNVSLICNLFGQWLGLEEESLKNLTIAGLLHDIGKMKVDPQILNKPSKLTSEEFEEIKKHSIYGFEILQKQAMPDEVKIAVLQHHERFDGSGYPAGASNEEIHIFAKIIAIADVYDAMTSKRPYRDKFSPFKVIQTLEKEGYGKLDTKFLMLFLQNIAYYYLGSWVQLSTGEQGEIVFIHPNHLSTPIVRVDQVLRDLKNEKEIEIEAII